MLRLVLVGSVAVLTVLMAVACGGGDSPTSTAAQDGSGGSEVTAVPTSTAAQDGSGGSEVTAAPTSTAAQDGSGSSEATVSEYLVWCVERGRARTRLDVGADGKVFGRANRRLRRHVLRRRN